MFVMFDLISFRLRENTRSYGFLKYRLRCVVLGYTGWKKKKHPKSDGFLFYAVGERFFFPLVKTNLIKLYFQISLKNWTLFFRPFWNFHLTPVYLILESINTLKFAILQRSASVLKVVKHNGMIDFLVETISVRFSDYKISRFFFKESPCSIQK